MPSRPVGAPLIDPAAWRAAQGMLAAKLAQVALRMGLLTARLVTGGAGFTGILAAMALIEVREAADPVSSHHGSREDLRW